MAGFVLSEFPSHLGELERVARQRPASGNYSAGDALLRALACIGAPVTAGAGRVQATIAARRAARRRSEERWNVALCDARTLADQARPWRE